MSQPEALLFHQQRYADAIKSVQDQIKFGTKASSPEKVAYRYAHPTYQGVPQNNSGGFNRPFFSNKDESHCPLEEKIRLRGGISRQNYPYVEQILNRRVNDATNIQLMKEGQPPIPESMPVLTELDSRLLDLNNNLRALSDLVEQGPTGISSITFQEFNKLPRQLVQLAPTMTPAQLTQIIQFLGDIEEQLVEYEDRDIDLSEISPPTAPPPAAPRPRGAPRQEEVAQRTAAELMTQTKLASQAEFNKLLTPAISLVQSMLSFLRRYMQYATADPKQRMVAASQIAKDIFNLSKRALLSVPGEAPAIEDLKTGPTISARTLGYALDKLPKNALYQIANQMGHSIAMSKKEDSPERLKWRQNSIEGDDNSGLRTDKSDKWYKEYIQKIVKDNKLNKANKLKEFFEVNKIELPFEITQ